MRRGRRVFYAVPMLAILPIVVACSESGKSPQATSVPVPEKVNMSEKSQGSCANTMEQIIFCKERGWDGPSAGNFFGPQAARERFDALTHLQANGNAKSIQDVFDSSSGTCKSIVKINGQYKGSDYSATLYCDKTFALGDLVKLEREKTSKSK